MEHPTTLDGWARSTSAQRETLVERARLDGRDVPIFPTVTRTTGLGTVAGLPCVSVPAGRSTGGLPVGLSVEGVLTTSRGVADAAAPSCRMLA